MWGEEAKIYWENPNAKEKNLGIGIVVIFSWASISSVQLMNKFTLLYSSLGWNSLICSPHFLTPFFPEKAASVAFLLLKELIQVLRLKACPVVFASFSVGAKACMYKVIQMISGTLEAHLNQDDTRLVRDCLSGFMFDSGPIDCSSDVGAKFSLHPVIHKTLGATKLVSWMVKLVTYGSDALFLTKFEAQNNEYWSTLHSSINFGAPVLFFCSESDNFAPCRVICDFAQHLEDLGGDIELVKWKDSPHLGHYEHYADEYRATLTSFLEKASSVFSSRMQQRALPRIFVEGTDDEIPGLICNLQKAAVSSRWKHGNPDMGSNELFFEPQGTSDFANSQDEKEKSINVPSNSIPRISAHSILGQVLFDACVPKNVEGWDIRFSGSLNGQPFASAHRRPPLGSKSLRCIRRSRL